ncbi:portal protein [Klebsiella pneumoniae]
MDSNNQTKSLNKILTNIRAGVSSDKEADVLAQIEQLKSQAESDHSQFIERFNESYLYYTARKPGKGIHQSRYVEPVLYNAVKAALPQLLDSFTSDDGLAVAFRSRGYRKNPMLENLITYNLNKIFLRDQDGYEILEGSFKTSLIAGDSFVKVYVDETTHKETATVEDWIDLIEFMTTIDEDWTINPPKSFGKDKSGSFKGFEWKEQVKTLVDQQTGQQIKQPEILIKGAVPLIKREKKLIVEELEPHDVWFDTAYGSDFSKCRYICHRVKTTVGEAKLRGFDADKLDKASDTKYEDSVLPDLFFSSVNYDSPTGAASGRMERNSSVDDNERPISLYEHYFYSSIPNKKNETRLYQAVTSGGELLSLEEIKRMPFVHGKCEPVQGSFFSRSFYDVCKPFQDNLSEMMRINLDKGAFTVYPRFRAVKGQYDRGSLQNNRPGAVIEELSSGAVQLFENYELPQTFALAQTNLKQSMSDTVAQSVGFANADGGVPQVATATAYLSIFQESQKGMVLTNNLKRTLVQPLYCLIYEIMRDEGFTLYAPDGSKVSGAELPALYDMIADPSTTHDDYAQNMQRQSVAAFVLQAALNRHG